LVFISARALAVRQLAPGHDWTIRLLVITLALRHSALAQLAENCAHPADAGHHIRLRSPFIHIVTKI
jgi:hypothetical protein